MKLLSEDLLKEFGFIEDASNKQPDELKVMTKGKINLVMRADGIFYRNMGFFYPLKDLAALRKLYKEIMSENLKPL